MRFLISLLVAFSSVTAMNTTFFIESFGLISQIPSGCEVSCANRCLMCTFVKNITQSCNDSPFYELKKSGNIPLMTGLYSKSPPKACAGDYLMISAPGEYHITVNVVHNVPQFIIYNTLISSFGSETIAITFAPGFQLP